ncbi:hypothetical protein V7654_03730 [Bacillus sp. JJ1609]|uniref:hypothetical protein n=1 Tax=Bacillus sp. JJ1609 TaxID=3122977 RepID=UPI002FFE89E4
MQVTNHSVSRQLNESQTRINPGEVTPVLVKDRLGANEAVVMIKGQEYRAEFEESVPAADRLVAEVIRTPEKGKVLLRQAGVSSAAKPIEDQSIDVRLLKVGIDPSKKVDLKNAVQILDAKSIPLTKDNFVALNRFINEAQGTIQEKIEAVKVIAQKNLPVSLNHLNAIHIALHGPALKDTLLELTGGKEIEFDSPVKNSVSMKELQINKVKPNKNDGNPLEKTIELVLQQLKKGAISIKDIESITVAIAKNTNPELQKLNQEIVKALQIQVAGAERISQAEMLNNNNSTEELKVKLEQLRADGIKLQQISQARLSKSLETLALLLKEIPADTGNDQDLVKLQSLVKEVQKEPSISKVLQVVSEALEELGDQNNIDLTLLKSAYEKAQRLSDQGRELAARKVLAEAINQLEKDNPILQKGADSITLTEADQYAINESLQALSLQSKSILVTEITKKLSQMAIDFKKVKQEITKSLDHVSLLLDKGGSKVNAKQTLDAAINKLDNAILKSNFMLYTDMLTEKKMLTASSRLTEARNLLAKGDYSQASQIVTEVKAVLDQTIFKPSTTRVQHFVSEQSLLKSVATMEDQFAFGIKQAVRPMPEQDYSARQVFESLKRLGLTHENDAANSLVFGSKAEQEEVGSNVKSMLIKMTQEGEAQAVKAEQALSSLTGQQLLNKQDSSGMQNLFMQMPFLLNQKTENIKVFINSQKSGEKIDWENCSLYFVLETKKLGEVGIMVTAQNRNVSITFNSNKDNLEHVLSPMSEISKVRLQEIGYNLEALKTKKASASVQTFSDENQSQSMTPAFTEKGYDFSI